MNSSSVQAQILLSPLGYACYRVVNDQYGKITDFCIVEINRAFAHLLGLDYSNQITGNLTELPQHIGNTCFDFFYYVSTQSTLDEVQIEKTGKWVTVHKSDSEEGFITIFLTDITNLKQVKDYKESEIRYRQVFEHANDAIFIMSNDKFVDCNGKTLEMFGCEREDIIDHEPYKFSPPKQPDGEDSTIKAQRKINQALNGVPQRFEWVHSRKDGTLFNAEVSLNAFTDAKGEVFIQAIVRDISIRKKAERSIAENELFRNRVFESSHTPIIIMDPTNHRFIDCNPAAVKIYGFASKDETIGLKPLDVSAPFQYDDTPSEAKAEQYINQALEKGSVIFEWKHQRPNGETWDSEVHLLCFSIDQQLLLQFSLIDISDRKKAENHLRERENRYSTLLKSITDTISILNAQGVQTYISPSVVRQTGYTAEELLGTSMPDIIHPDDLPHVFEKWKEILENPFAYSSVSYRHIHKTKGWVHLETVGQNLLLDPSIQGVVLNIRDISERIRSEKTLQDIIDKNPMSIQIVDKQGHTLKINASHTKLFGAVPPPDYSVFDDPLILKQNLNYLFEKVQNGEVAYFPDFYFNAHDLYSEFPSKPIWIRMVVFPLLDAQGEPDRYVLIHDDITERKQHEAELAAMNEELSATSDALRESNDSILQAKDRAERNEERYLAFIKNSTEGIFRLEMKIPMDISLDIESQIDFIYENAYMAECNQRCVEMFNATSIEELIGIPLIVFHGGKNNPDNRDQMHDFIVNGYKISEKITNELNTKGETVSFSNNSVGIIENGKLVRMWGTQTDVTERVNLHNDLVKAKNKAEESDRLKSVFLANISHEIRTPMNAILGFLELLKNPDLIREDKDSFIDIINQSGQRLLSTINDLVEISKIEAGQLDVVSSEVNLADFILYIYKMLVPQCQKKGLELSLSDSARNAQVVIKTDKYKLEGILINLINNAIKFTKTGGIAIDLALDGDKILFMVKDTGIGIPFDRQKAIFDRFVHAEMDNTRPYEGSGLGLSIAKAYVELLQGEIWVESDGKNGSTFYFTIEHNPIRRLTVDTIVPENLIGIKSKITILVAEDDEFSFKLVEGILANQNVTLIHLFNGEDAVQYVRENPNTSLILMDIKMPIMNGIEATKRIREFNKTIPIIAQTAYALSGDRDKVIEAGCNDYISKPLNHSLLIKLVKEYTEQ